MILQFSFKEILSEKAFKIPIPRLHIYTVSLLYISTLLSTSIFKRWLPGAGMGLFIPSAQTLYCKCLINLYKAGKKNASYMQVARLIKGFQIGTDENPRKGGKLSVTIKY